MSPNGDLPVPAASDDASSDHRQPDAAAVAGERAARQTAERARDTAAAIADRFSFLAEVSRCLADSIDYETTLATVAGMALPYLDAWCIVDVLQPDGEIRRLAVLHPDPGKQETARELHRRYPPHPDDLIGAPRVIRTSRAEMVFEVPDEAVSAAARDAEHLALLRTLGVEAYVIVPMVARGQLLGAMTFVTAERGRRFGDIDVVIAEDLARRAAMGIDNARLYGEALQARAIAEDTMAELEATNDELETANRELAIVRDTAQTALKARSEFLATMTHEVRTPLNAIVGYTELMEMDLAGGLSETQRGYVQRVRDSSQHLQRLVDDVLDLSRSEVDRLVVAHDPVRAADTARAALAIVRPQAAARLVSLADETAGAVGLEYQGDAHRVRQILLNLLSNAIKFTPAGGSVTLSCALEDGAAGPGVAFRVTDTGQGVNPRDAEAIFEPFVQGETGLTRTHDGTGLGLSISRRLARLMGGDVRLLPEAEGGGAVFELRVPAAPAGVHAEGGADDGAAAPLTVPHGTATERAAARRGLGAAGGALLHEMGSSLLDFVERARADSALGVTDEMTDVEVADHLATLLTDLANSLTVLGNADGEPTEGLMDGNRIQRVIGELHGAHRRRLGWSEDQLLREAQLIRDVCHGAIGRAVDGDEAGKEAATIALSRLLGERMRACLDGFRGAPGAAS